MKKVKPKDNIKIEYERFEHLKVLKQIMSMFSSMSNICERYPDIKTFILVEQSNVFPVKHVRVYMNMYLGDKMAFSVQSQLALTMVQYLHIK